MFFAQPVKKSVDGIMSAFNVAITDLEAVKQRELEAIQQTELEIRALQAQAAASRTEALRADSVSLKLKSLVGV